MAAMLFQAAFWGTAMDGTAQTLFQKDKFASRSHVGWSFDRCWIFGPVPWRSSRTGWSSWSSSWDFFPLLILFIKYYFFNEMRLFRVNLEITKKSFINLFQIEIKLISHSQPVWYRNRPFNQDIISIWKILGGMILIQ